MEGANSYLVTVLEKGIQPGSEGSEDGKIAIDQFVLPADNRSASVFGQKVSAAHSGVALSDASLSKSEGPLKAGQIPQSELHFPADALPRPTGNEFVRPEKQAGMKFPDPVSPDDWQKESL